MSIKEPKSRWATEQLSKPGAEMSDEEWEARKRWIDDQRALRGEAPIDWRGVRKPLPIPERVRAYIRSMNLPDE